MRKIILLSQNPKIAFRRQKLLRSVIGDCEVTACCSEQEAMWIILSEAFDLGVFDVKTLSLQQPHFGEMVRASGFEFPMVVSGKIENEIQFFKKLPRRSNMIFLREPMEYRELLGVAKKLLQAGIINQPIDRRFATNEKVVVEKFASKIAIPSALYNVSLGGACLEFPLSSPDLKIGDILGLHFQLGEGKKPRKVGGRVVWTQVDRKASKKYAGVSFAR